MVERSSELRCENFELRSILLVDRVREDENFGNLKSLAGQPDNVVVEGFRSGVVEQRIPAELSGTDQTAGKKYGQAQKLVEAGSQGRVGFFEGSRKLAQNLLVDIMRGHAQKGRSAEERSRNR